MRRNVLSHYLSGRRMPTVRFNPALDRTATGAAPRRRALYHQPRGATPVVPDQLERWAA